MDEQNVQAQSAPQTAESVGSTEQHGTVGLSTDARTGRKYITSIPDNQGAGAETSETPAEAPAAEQGTEQAAQAENEVFPQGEASTFGNIAPQEPEPQVPQAYTPAEMSLAMQLGQVDESRIPAEYMPQYTAMKLKDAPPPKSAEEIRQEFLNTVTANVKQQTMQEVGITEDELALGEFADDAEIAGKVERYKLALEMNRRKAVDAVYDRIKEEQDTAKANRQFRQGIADWISTQRAQEPHFDDIGKYMTEHYKTMRYEDAKAIAPAVEAALKGQLTPRGAEIIQKYYEGCRKEYYAKLNNTSTTPAPRAPDVETKGGGRNVNENPDYGKLLREASPRDKSRVIDAWLSSMRK